MKRFRIDQMCGYSCIDAEMEADEAGEYVLYADVEPIIADRDIKAANLETLVDLVLAYEERANIAVANEGCIGDIADADEAYNEMLDLARGLKQ